MFDGLRQGEKILYVNTPSDSHDSTDLYRVKCAKKIPKFRLTVMFHYADVSFGCTVQLRCKGQESQTTNVVGNEKVQRYRKSESGTAGGPRKSWLVMN